LKISGGDQLSGLLTRCVFEHKVKSVMLRAEEEGVPVASG
jgi:PleD family two-component response regulator